MNLSVPSADNLSFMIEEIKKKLKMASGAAMRPEHFSLNHYDDIKYIYDMIMSKDRFSINEMEAIVSELGSMRK